MTLPSHIVDQLLAADCDADGIADLLIAESEGSVIVARNAVSDTLRSSLHTTTTQGAGCPHTGSDKIFEGPRPILYLPGRSIGSCLECLSVMLHSFSQDREGCDLCPSQSVTTTLIVKDHNAVWLAEVCDDCASTILEAQYQAFGDPGRDDPR